MERASSSKGIGPVQRFGRYTLVKRLATGGMAEIWLARQSGLAGFNRFVVVKKILAHLSEESTFVEMFLDEARTSAQLNHPNIVQIYDLGREGESYFIAMEYIAGENLAAMAWRGLKVGHKLSLPLAARIIADTCKALHHAHHLRGSDGRPLEIVHRDVSPQNILVTYDGEVKVVDFGIAKAATKSEQTKTGMLKGKFSYMSPEQCLGAPVDMRSDIFALGILLYELTTGRRLFKHDSELMILEMITKRTVTPPSLLEADFPPALDRIIMRALEKEANDRYPHARAMQLELEAYLRETTGPASHADLATHMRSLFADRIDEKRRLIELASRDDFEERFVDESERVTVRPVVHGASPSQMSPAAPGRSAGSETAMPSGYVQPSETRAVPTRSSWGAGLLLGLALFVMAVSASVLWSAQRGPGSGSGISASGAERRGKLRVDSLPPGATIYLDGEPMRLPDNTFARTPSDIDPLFYGRRYDLELRLDGHAPFRQTLEMGDDLDGAKLRPVLEPLPAQLRVRVDGPEAKHVRVFVDDRDIGLGPELSRRVPAGPVKVTAQLADHRCRATPDPASVLPGGEVAVSVRCEPDPRTPPSAEPRPTPTRVAVETDRAPASATPDRPARPRVEGGPRPGSGAGARRSVGGSTPPPAPGGCVANPDLPPGFVTVDTQPYSEIFWRGRRLGETPLARYELPSGCVELEARSPRATKRFKVEVEPNQVSIYRLRLE